MNLYYMILFAWLRSYGPSFTSAHIPRNLGFGVESRPCPSSYALTILKTSPPSTGSISPVFLPASLIPRPPSAIFLACVPRTASSPWKTLTLQDLSSPRKIPRLPISSPWTSQKNIAAKVSPPRCSPKVSETLPCAAFATCCWKPQPTTHRPLPSGSVMVIVSKRLSNVITWAGSTLTKCAKYFLLPQNRNLQLEKVRTRVQKRCIPMQNLCKTAPNTCIPLSKRPSQNREIPIERLFAGRSAPHRRRTHRISARKLDGPFASQRSPVSHRPRQRLLEDVHHRHPARRHSYASRVFPRPNRQVPQGLPARRAWRPHRPHPSTRSDGRSLRRHRDSLFFADQGHRQTSRKPTHHRLVIADRRRRHVDC